MMTKCLDIKAWANSIESDYTPQNLASDQELQFAIHRALF